MPQQADADKFALQFCQASINKAGGFHFHKSLTPAIYQLPDSFPVSQQPSQETILFTQVDAYDPIQKR